MPKVCPKCGDANQELSVFCKSCGFTLAKTRLDFKATVKAPERKPFELSVKPQKLKICPQCNTANKVQEHYCIQCSSILPEYCIKEMVVDIEAECRKDMEKEAKKRRIIGAVMTIWILGITLASIILGGDLKVILMGNFVIILSVLSLLFPEEFFKLSNIFTIKEVELTDLYYLLNTVGCVLTIVIISVLMVISLLVK